MIILNARSLVSVLALLPELLVACILIDLKIRETAGANAEVAAQLVFW